MPSEHRDSFPSTRWSRIQQPAGSRDLDALARAYWRPIRAWLMARQRCGPQQADDLAQDAFAFVLQRDVLAKADPQRGSFRGYLKTVLANFAIEQHRRERAQKRGGEMRTLSLEDAEPPIAGDRGPDQALDDAWRRQLLADAAERLRTELEGNGRALYHRLFHDYYLADGVQPDHQTLAARHGITRTDVSNWLDYGRRRYRAILRELVADTVRDEATLQEEWHWLFGEGAVR